MSTVTVTGASPPTRRFYDAELVDVGTPGTAGCDQGHDYE